MAEPQFALLDINRASFDELVMIRGIGPVLAERIIAHRPYSKTEDLVNAPGINQTKLMTLLPFITVTSKKTKPTAPKTLAQPTTEQAAHVSKLGDTETFVFLEDRNDRQDALLIIFGGFILGLIIVMLRRANR